MADSLQSHGLQGPWNSLGQNTGVGSLSLLQGIFPNEEEETKQTKEASNKAKLNTAIQNSYRQHTPAPIYLSLGYNIVLVSRMQRGDLLL